MVNQGLNGHRNAKLFLNKYFEPALLDDAQTGAGLPFQKDHGAGIMFLSNGRPADACQGSGIQFRQVGDGR